VHRSLQLQLLGWLAALAVVGAIATPSTDAGLFAATFVVGAALLRVRESWRWEEHVERRRGSMRGLRDRRWMGDVLGASFAWSVVFARARFSGVSWIPRRLDIGTLVLAAAIPSVVVLLRVVNAARRRARLRRLDVD
jgi:hypothetical protein